MYVYTHTHTPTHTHTRGGARGGPPSRNHPAGKIRLLILFLYYIYRIRIDIGPVLFSCTATLVQLVRVKESMFGYFPIHAWCAWSDRKYNAWHELYIFCHFMRIMRESESILCLFPTYCTSASVQLKRTDRFITGWLVNDDIDVFR